MKIQKNYLPIAIIALAVLISSSMMSPVSVTTGQTSSSSTIHTGDTFKMTTSQDESEDSFWSFKIHNVTNANQWFR
ncbi:MAG: hypothetical protein ACXAB7_19455, partial [Candidatus Kariarchaeaceae archaeon]